MVRRRCGIAKQFFRAALRKRLIDANPFDGVDATVKSNRANDYYITRKEAAAGLDACPDVQWRLLFALSRFGGLRCPSEHLGLRWGDIDWQRGRFRVTLPKTAHHDGQGDRFVPLFPELRPILADAFDATEPGQEYVINRPRDSGTNRRTHMLRIIRTAGLVPWPKLFHNLRASRQTELAAINPAHLVCEWLGNTPAVAREHDLRVTDSDYERAAEEAGGTLQNPVQYTAAYSSTESPAAKHQKHETPVFPGVAASWVAERSEQLGVAGFEPATSTV